MNVADRRPVWLQFTKAVIFLDFSTWLVRRTLLRIALSAGIAAIAGFQLIHFISWSPRQLASHGLILDDAFFYSVIARNYHQYGYLTFDGNMLTNGVQPLWMAIQILLVTLFPQENEVVLMSRASWVLYLLFSFLTIWFVTRRKRILEQGVAALTVGGLLLLNVRFQAFSVTGLETPLLLVLLMVMLIKIDGAAEIIRHQPNSKLSMTATLGLAFWAVLCFFARTDLFWVCIVVGLWLLIAGRQLRWNAVIYFTAAAVMVTPYLVYNLMTQAHIIPLSGRIKLFYLHLFYPNWQDYIHSNEWQGVLAAFISSFTFLGQLPFLATGALVILTILIAQLMVWQKRTRQLFPVSLQILTVIAATHIISMQRLMWNSKGQNVR